MFLLVFNIKTKKLKAGGTILNKCPYCGAEMKNGFVTSGALRSFLYFEEKQDIKDLKDKILNWFDTSKEVMLAEKYTWTVPKVEADYCEQCKKVIINVPEIKTEDDIV